MLDSLIQNFRTCGNTPAGDLHMYKLLRPKWNVKFRIIKADSQEHRKWKVDDTLGSATLSASKSMCDKPFYTDDHKVLNFRCAWVLACRSQGTHNHFLKMAMFLTDKFSWNKRLLKNMKWVKCFITLKWHFICFKSFYAGNVLCILKI
jgi:hypothetical protein